MALSCVDRQKGAEQNCEGGLWASSVSTARENERNQCLEVLIENHNQEYKKNDTSTKLRISTGVCVLCD